MYESDAEEFSQELAELCAAHDKPMSNERMKVYWRVLKPYPWPLIKAKIRAAATYEKFPKPADLAPKNFATETNTDQPSIIEQLTHHILKNYNLSREQTRLPWRWLHKGYAHLPAPDQSDPNFAIVGVMIPGDDEREPFKVMVSELQ